MLKLQLRKHEELTKEFWAKTVDLIGFCIAMVFLVSLILSIIPLIYKTSPEIIKFSWSLFICMVVCVGISYLLRRFSE